MIGHVIQFNEYFLFIIQFAHELHIEYLSWRACIGLWLMLFVVIFALSEASFLVKYFTRFSEEVFTGVIALFFTFEAIRTIVKVIYLSTCIYLSIVNLSRYSSVIHYVVLSIHVECLLTVLIHVYVLQ